MSLKSKSETVEKTDDKTEGINNLSSKINPEAFSEALEKSDMLNLFYYINIIIKDMEDKILEKEKQDVKTAGCILKNINEVQKLKEDLYALDIIVDIIYPVNKSGDYDSYEKRIKLFMKKGSVMPHRVSIEKSNRN